MTPNEHRTVATARHSRWPGWIWAVPIAALAIVAWLGVRDFLHHGPKVEVTFTTAGGIEAGDTDVKYKGVKVGKVEDVKLTKDLSHVVATLRMEDRVENYLTEGTRFWIVGAKLDFNDVSALKTIVSGSYVEMDPGPGKPARHYIGLEEPPPVRSHAPGTRFVLHSGKLGSVKTGSTVTYLGLQVGTVEHYALDQDGRRFNIGVFIRAPYDKLVHGESRFWDAGALSLSTGPGGLSADVSPKAVLSGSVAFETPPEAATSPPSNQGAVFTLYGDHDAARHAPIGPRVSYVVRFPGAVGDLSVGAAVKLKGFHVGQVTNVILDYDAASGNLQTPVTIELEPARFGMEGQPTPSGGNWAPMMNQALDRLIQQGLRARLEQSTPVIGGKEVVLDFVPSAQPATLVQGGTNAEIPATGGGDIAGLTAKANDIMDTIDRLPLQQIAGSLRQTVEHVQGLVSSPELAQSIAHLDHTLANLERTTRQASGKVGPLIQSLRQTADAAQATVASANTVLGGGGDQQNDLPGTLRELTDAARSIRSLANYLDRHPEALVQGKTGAQ